jgi:hypothetical protein
VNIPCCQRSGVGNHLPKLNQHQAWTKAMTLETHRPISWVRTDAKTREGRLLLGSLALPDDR